MVHTADSGYMMPADIGHFYLGRNVMEYGDRPSLMHVYLKDFHYCYDVIMNEELHAPEMAKKMNWLANKMAQYIYESEGVDY